MRSSSLRLFLSGLFLVACGARSGLGVDEEAADGAVVGEDAAPDVAPPETRVSCTPTLDAPLEIPSRGETRFVASHLGATGARLVVLHGRDVLELLALDFEARTARPLAGFAASVGRTEVSRVGFDAAGGVVGLCGEDRASLRLLDDAGDERVARFPDGIENCSSVGFANGQWLVVAKEWATPAPATLLRFSSSLELTGRTDLRAPMRSFVGGGPPLFDTVEGFAFVYRAFEGESWPDEALRLQRLRGDFEVVGEPVELIGEGIINGDVWTVAEDLAYFLLFRPQTMELASGEGPHFRTYTIDGLSSAPSRPLLDSGHGLNFTLHATGDGLYWVWIDPGAGFEPGVPGSGSEHRLLLQPLTPTGEALAPPIPLHQEPGQTAIRPVIRSRVEADRHDLLVAWQAVGVTGGLQNVYASLVTCARR